MVDPKPWSTKIHRKCKERKDLYLHYFLHKTTLKLESLLLKHAKSYPNAAKLTSITHKNIYCLKNKIWDMLNHAH